MNWYLASRVRHKQYVQEIIKLLESQNHNVIYDWSKLGSLKPYKKNSDEASRIANEISQALRDVDVFVLFSDKGGTDMFIELGITIGKWLDNKNIRIYAVGKYNDRSLMHFHPAIKQVDKIENVFSVECPEILSKIKN